MGRTVAELLESISSEELSEWMIYEKMEPFGQPWEAKAFGQVCAVDANANKKKGARAYKWSDFFQVYGETVGPTEQQAGGGVESPRSIWAKAAIITEAYKARERGQ